jgi:hypothetical protein
MNSELVNQLKSNLSAKRESAAKKIGKLKDPIYGPVLLEALIEELKDPRTWKVQYQLILSLGFCNYHESIDYISALLKNNFDASIIHMAIGDTYLRLSKNSIGIDTALNNLMAINDPRFIYGGLRGAAMCKLVPSDETINKIIARAQSPKITDQIRGYPGDDSGIRLWILVAARNWKIELVRKFIDDCKRIKNDQVKLAIDSLINNKDIKWAPY